MICKLKALYYPKEKVIVNNYMNTINSYCSMLFPKALTTFFNNKWRVLVNYILPNGYKLTCFEVVRAIRLVMVNNGFVDLSNVSIHTKLQNLVESNNKIENKINKTFFTHIFWSRIHHRP